MDKNELELAEVPELEPQLDEEGNDTTDWKAIAEERHQLATKNYGFAKRLKTKLEKSLEKPEKTSTEVKPIAPEKQEFGDAQYAFLAAKGIPDEDYDFVEENVKNTGKNLRELLGTKWFQAELKDRKDARAAQEAASASSGKRSGSPASDDISYHVRNYKEGLASGKGEVLPEDPVMRRKVVQALRNEGKSAGSDHFSSNPIVG